MEEAGRLQDPEAREDCCEIGLWTGPGCCSHEFRVSMIACTRSSQSTVHCDGGPHKAQPLAESYWHQTAAEEGRMSFLQGRGIS